VLYEEEVVTRDPVFGRESRAPAAPRHPESVAAFARWAGAAAVHFRGRGVVWEVWNEPNIGFWRPRPDVKEYATLLLATIRAVRGAEAGALVVAPATSEFPWSFLETLFATPGVLEGLDGISVHPYRSRAPETVVEDYVRLRALIEAQAPPGKRALPILSGEWGYSSYSGGVSPEVQAAYLVRQQLVNVWQGVPVSIWYDWKNDGSDPKEREHHFGTVTAALEPKPAYRALQVLTRELAGYRVVRRLAVEPVESGDSRAYVFLLNRDGVPPKLAAWSGDRSQVVYVETDLEPGDGVAVVDGLGQPAELKLEGKRLRLELQALPQYVTWKQPSSR
jgi:hypothetical protein